MPFGSEKKILKLFTMYWHGGHLGHVTRIIPRLPIEALHEKLKVSNDRKYVQTEQISP